MRAYPSKVPVLLGALCFALMLSALVAGPEESSAAVEPMVEGGTSDPNSRSIEISALWPMAFTGPEPGEQRFPPVQQARLGYSSQKADKGVRGALPRTPAGLSPCTLLLAALHRMGAPPRA
ncbi:MAG: hypothetical protein FWF86_06405 [Clostridia bacterium]|nr:hypothetical protein [Clostridia bacterium]